MDELLLLIKLSHTKVQVEIMMVIAAVTVEAVIVTVAVIMEVGVDLVVEESASSVASQDILRGSVLVKVQEGAAGMVVGMISTVEAEEVVVAAMVLIEMETDTVGAAGILVQVVVQVLEVIVSVVTALDHMSVGGQEVSVLDRTIASDSGRYHISYPTSSIYLTSSIHSYFGTYRILLMCYCSL